jgi:hypothetical protein
MQKNYAVMLTALLLSSCVAPTPPPPAFTGSVAFLSMTSVTRGPFAENVFIVSAINGQPFAGEIYPSEPPPDVSLSPITGPLTSVTIPASQPTRFTLSGYSVFQAPIFAMTMADYTLSGDINFVPVAGQNYTVKGTFTPSYSALWIENEDTGQLAAPKLEVHGSAKVPLF